MEGRAIARPDSTGCGPRFCVSAMPTALQWRAEQLLGQTMPVIARVMVDRRAQTRFNGGPSNCSARRSGRRLHRPGVLGASMEGRAIARPDSAEEPARRPRRLTAASMEGRAIARPDQRGFAPSVMSLTLSFNGGPSNCSARHHRCRCRKHLMSSPKASMEGRAIARPDSARRYNASPDRSGPASMEGRAIARPDTKHRGHPAHTFNVGASMEGRAMARPDQNAVRAVIRLLERRSFNGGPSNCSARRRRIAGSWTIRCW